MLAFLLLEFIFQTYESSHCGADLPTENKRKHSREKREEKMKNLKKVIEDKNGKCYQSETVETVATEDEPIIKKTGQNSIQQIKRRSSIVLNNSIQKIFGDRTRYR